MEQLEQKLPLDKSWDIYQQLLSQQADTLSTGADIEALRYGLERFPSLERITITPAAHGHLFRPLYETPMIRALPYGFVYPIPRGWPVGDSDGGGYEVLPWDDEVEREKWRGFCIVVRELANFPLHHISELLLETHGLETGLNCRIFDEPNEDYDNLVKLLRQPGFRRIDLALLADGQEFEGYRFLRSGLLKAALAEAKNLEHITLRPHMDYDSRATKSGTPESVEHFTSLNTIFPIDQWPQLRHFGLSHLPIRQDDLFSLLAAMPPTLECVELGFLRFLGDGGNHPGLLSQMRDSLGWEKRGPSRRPRVKVIMANGNSCSPREIWLDDVVNKYLYEGGEEMFSQSNRAGSSYLWPKFQADQDPFDFVV